MIFQILDKSKNIFIFAEKIKHDSKISHISSYMRNYVGSK